MLAASVVIIRDGSSEPINPPTRYWPDITLITPDIINYWFLLSPTKHIIYLQRYLATLCGNSQIPLKCCPMFPQFLHIFHIQISTYVIKIRYLDIQNVKPTSPIFCLGMTSMEKNCIFKDTVSIMGGRVGKNSNLKVGTQFSREGGGLKNKKVFLILKVRIY